jgi:hypothetical protein
MIPLFEPVKIQSTSSAPRRTHLLQGFMSLQSFFVLDQAQ